MTVQRVVLVLAALMVIGWSAVSYANSVVIKDVKFVAGDQGASNEELEHALRRTRDAGKLDPSRGVEALSYKASLQFRLNRVPDGLQTLDEVVRREPDFVDAWFLIATFTPNRERAAEAAAQVRRLNPRARR